ncbi:MAG: prolyl aminopeptidase [Gammaproteobacteria bacterium]
MLTHYPSIDSYAEYQLAVQPPHVLHLEESGNPHGIPVLFVHGGPGAGTKPDQRRFFDPTIYRIILFDQRGAGRSTPHACIEHNNTRALIADIETIREFLNIDRWVIFGGSWGSTLSLVYAQAHPERVMGMILRSIFLGREQDIHWLAKPGGASQVYPDHWEDLIAPIPLTERHNLLAAYHKRLNGTDDISAMHAAKTWALWESRCLMLDPDTISLESHIDPSIALSLARLECHYMSHACFLKPNQILDNMSAIGHLPAIIIHGRYDMVCPVEQAWSLHRAWPQSTLQIIRAAGHASSEPGITDALVHATKTFGARFS